MHNKNTNIDPAVPSLATFPVGLSDYFLNPEILFLNHGSFGAVLRHVYELQDEWRRRIEADPIEVIGRQTESLLAKSKEAVGHYLGMKPADFGLTSNATEGCNNVLRCLELKAGDDILTTNFVYGAVRQAIRYVCERSGASFREAQIPLPITSAQVIVDTIVSAIQPNTKLVVIDHVTSATALVFPVEKIIAECTKRNIDVLVDGAHAPGMVPLDVEKLNVAYYAGNLHKWTCMPKGCAFVYVRPDHQKQIHPSVISHYLGQGFAREFDWTGTRDLSNWFVIPEALEYMSKLDWTKIRARNHALAVWAHQMLVTRFGVTPISPLDGSLLGSMATVAMPGKLFDLTEETCAPFRKDLFHKHKIEMPLVDLNKHMHLRVSCQLYNSPADYIRLADVIQSLA